MMKLKHNKISWIFLLAPVIPGFAFAQEGETEQQAIFSGALYVEARNVQNANRTVVEASQVTEVQTEYGARLAAAIDRELIELSAEYRFAQYNFSESTQEDRFIYTGQSALIFGTQNTWYQLEIEHSTQRFLVNPIGPTILANTDQRNITTASPRLRLQPGNNNIVIAGHYADIRYEEIDLNNSQRMGVSLAWLREASPLYTYGVRVLQNDVDYEFSTAADYTYRRASVVFNAELRLLDYTLQIGANEAVPEVGSSVSRLFYDLEINYNHYSNSWFLTAQRSITDTSLGNANNPFFSEGITADVSSMVQDQLERSSYGIGWRSKFPCPLCEVAIRAGYEEEEYFTVTAENQSEIFVGTTFSYLLRPSITLEFSLNHRRRDFAEVERYDDYRESTAIAAVDITPVFRYFAMRFWGEYENRNPEAGASYSSRALGITLAYEF